MKDINKYIFILFIFIFTSQNCKSQGLNGFSDENLTICIDKKENKVSGFINANLYVDDRPEKGIYQSCNVYFIGNFLNLDSPFKIQVYNGVESGQFTFGEIIINEKERLIKISLKESVISCSNIFDLKFGEVFKMGSPIEIIKCSRVISERAYLWKNGKRKKIYLIKGDFVAIIQEKNKSLVKVKYKNKNLQTIEGWIKKSDVE